MRDELGISEVAARAVQAALTSAATFAVGAAMPLLMVVVSPGSVLVPIVSAASLGFLALLGAIGARAGGVNIWRATARVTFWGALAMALTAGIGKRFRPWCDRSRRRDKVAKARPAPGVRRQPDRTYTYYRLLTDCLIFLVTGPSASMASAGVQKCRSPHLGQCTAAWTFGSLARTSASVSMPVEMTSQVNGQRTTRALISIPPGCRARTSRAPASSEASGDACHGDKARASA